MKRISFAIPVLCMVLFGCHQKNESRIYMSNDSCFQVISFNPDYHYTNLRFFNLSEVADTVEYIPLQTNEEIPVGEVRKLFGTGSRKVCSVSTRPAITFTACMHKDKGRENTDVLPTSLLT